MRRGNCFSLGNIEQAPKFSATLRRWALHADQRSVCHAWRDSLAQLDRSCASVIQTRFSTRQADGSMGAARRVDPVCRGALISTVKPSLGAGNWTQEQPRKAADFQR